MKKKMLLLSLLIFATSVIATTAFSSATPPTEVEREKDYYYFKIHGKSNPSTLQPYPEKRIGTVNNIYKNLAGSTQTVTIKIWNEGFSYEEIITIDGINGWEVSREDLGPATCGTYIMCAITINGVQIIKIDDPIIIVIPPS